VSLARFSNKPSYKILVVDDDALTRSFVRAILQADGLQVVLAGNGEEGLRLILTESPDLVLTDFSLPDMNGAELSRRIHAHHREFHGDLPMFPPIVVFTASDDPEVLKECLDAGAVEFLTKPFNGSELRTRIRAIAELASAHTGLLYREAEEQDEISMVKHLLDRLLAPGRATLPRGFEMETLQTRRINGDVCAYQAGAPGIHLGMICDPMGHGLMAGISEIPTMEVFSALAARDLPLPSILAEINRKLLHLLPGNRFSCVTLFRMDWHSSELSVVNAAMPDAFVFRKDGSLVRFASTSIPLGIQADLASPGISRQQLTPGDCFFACSDGLTDLVAEEELMAQFLAGGEEGFPLRLRDLLESRSRDRELADDVTWCLWPFRPESMDLQMQKGDARLGTHGLSSIQLCLSFQPEALDYHELGSNLAGFLGRHDVPMEVTQILALLLSEAIVNAVDHGALDLDSGLKESGFEVYEAQRLARLARGCLAVVDLRVAIHQGRDGNFSHLGVQVSDPGLGFDWQQWLAALDDASARPHGRGLLLLQTLSRDLAFNEAGNQVSFNLYGPGA
jgi:CheY-like chemotaxis protein/anti-sigma regulatory factor (Ser/Thr protein kinase)